MSSCKHFLGASWPLVRIFLLSSYANQHFLFHTRQSSDVLISEKTCIRTRLLPLPVNIPNTYADERCFSFVKATHTCTQSKKLRITCLLDKFINISNLQDWNYCFSVDYHQGFCCICLQLKLTGITAIQSSAKMAERAKMVTEITPVNVYQTSMALSARMILQVGTCSTMFKINIMFFNMNPSC